MKHIHAITDIDCIYNAKSSSFISNTNLANAGAHTFHRLPVIRITTALNQIKLETSFSAGATGKCCNDLARISQKFHVFHSLYQF